MKAAELYEFRKFRLTEIPDQEPGPGEVQVRVSSVGICGSDVHYFAEGAIGDTPCIYPMVLGHEPAGEIVKIGAGATGWSKGDKALLEPALYCYHCEYCLTGHHNVCANLGFLSTPGMPGFFREYVNLPVTNLVPLPENLSLEQGTLFEPLAVVLHSLKFAAPTVGDTALVFGGGPIGLLTILALRASGVRRIWCSEPIGHRREMAKQAGAHALIDPKSVDAAKQVLSDTGGRGVDISIDCASKEGTINQCLLATRPAGRVVITGIPSERYIDFDFHAWRRKEQFFFTVRRSNHETTAAIDLMREHPEWFGPLVTHVKPIEQIGESFEMLDRYEDGAGKVVLSFR